MSDDDKAKKQRKASERTSTQMDNVFETMLYPAATSTSAKSKSESDISASNQSEATVPDTKDAKSVISNKSTSSSVKRKQQQADYEAKMKQIEIRKTERALFRDHLQHEKKVREMHLEAIKHEEQERQLLLQELQDEKELVEEERKLRNAEVEDDGNESDDNRARGIITGLNYEELAALGGYDSFRKKMNKAQDTSSNTKMLDKENAQLVTQLLKENQRTQEFLDRDSKRKEAEGIKEHSEHHMKKKSDADARKAALELKIQELRDQAKELELQMVQVSQDSRDSDAIIERNMEALLKLEVPTHQLETREVNAYTSTEIPPISTTNFTPSNPIEQMALAMVEAFKSINQANPVTPSATASTTERFLARQSYGKELPIFTGRPEEWLSFIASYENSTKQCGFSHVDNFPRLQKSLKGEALKTVQCLMTTPDHVPEVIKILRLSFGKPEAIIRVLMEKAKSLSSFKEDKIEAHIEFGTAVRNLAITIQTLKKPEFLFNPALLEELESKMPVALRREWKRRVVVKPEISASLLEFNTWLQEETLIAYEMRSLKPEKEPAKAKQDDHLLRGRRGDKVFVMEDNEEKDSPRTPKSNGKFKNFKCNFCKTVGHRIQQCESFAKETPEERNKFVKANNLCFGCLHYGHSTKECETKKPCKKDGCELKHHSLIHMPARSPMKEDKRSKKSSSAKSSEVQGCPVEAQRDIVHLRKPQRENYFYAILPLMLRGPKGTTKIYAMWDNGSCYTLLDSSVSTALGLKESFCPLSFSGFGNEARVVPSSLVDVEVLNNKSGKVYSMKNINTYNGIPLSNQTLHQSLLDKHSHLQTTGLEAFHDVRISMLIGNPQYDLTLTNRIARSRSNPNAPVAIRCKIGWYLAGKMPTNNSKVPIDVLNIQPCNKDEDLNRLMKEHFSTEDFGVKATKVKARSKQDERAQQITDSTMRKVNGSWETGLLWESDHVSLPESKDMALKRLYSLERKLDRDPDYAAKYLKNIQHFMDVGYIQKVPEDELKKPYSNLWYLPHFGVINPNKPNKVRTVFDAAAKSHGTSLNHHLLTGTDQVQPLPSVLAKFRERKVAISGDIKEMFNRIKMRKEDQPAQRLLWRGMDRGKKPEEFFMSVMTFGAVCSPFCAQEAKNRNAKEHEEEFPKAAHAIVNKFYVDNYLDSCDTVEEALEMYEDIAEIHRRGDFQICQWSSNSKDFITKVPTDLRADSQKSFDGNNGEINSERILGLIWTPLEDTFTFKLNLHKIKEDILSGERIPTKREALSAVMSVFDPLGFASPITVKAKILLQDAWRTKIGWDDELPTSIHNKWSNWITELKRISNLKIPRCYSSYFSSSTEIQLHIFCDASESAFSAVGYFRITTFEGIHVNLVMGKSRVAPLKVISIPRMELQAAVLGSRLMQTIHDIHETKIHKNYLWTDSRAVISWLQADGKQFLQFVAHRIGEIQETTDVNSWRWIKGKINVADEATRDEKPSFTKESKWITGPDFLREPEETWNFETKCAEEIPSQEFMELKQAHILIINKEEPKLKPDISHFSSYLRLIRSTAWFNRAYLIWMKKVKFPSHLTVEELKQAEKDWWIQSQKESYSQELATLKNNEQITQGPLQHLSPYLDEEGLIRMRGRIQADVFIGSMDKNPIILHPKHRFTELLIHHHHIRAGYHGQERVMNELHLKYCIPNVRVAVRSCWSKCQQCKNRRVLPEAPEMGNLPAARLQSRVQPFTFSGVDYFGPYLITVGRSHVKRYGALFTCMTTRAVHLEVAHSLSTDSFLMTLRRFISRRGKPKEIYSDNGTNFVGANNELKLILDDLDKKKIKDEMTNKGIKWHFIPPLAPHMGGSWERMVRSVKTALDSILDERNPREETFLTLIIEVEGILNGRPLTHVSNDPDDPESLTPNHFLIGSSGNDNSAGNFTNSDLHRPSVQWKIAQRLADIFWTRWIKEYIPSLRKRNKWTLKKEPVKVGDIVVVNDEDLPRRYWRKGILTKIFPGPDGTIRRAEIRTQRGTFIRPVTRLGVLDVATPEDAEDSEVLAVIAAAKTAGGSMSSNSHNYEN